MMVMMGFVVKQVEAENRIWKCSSKHKVLEEALRRVQCSSVASAPAPPHFKLQPFVSVVLFIYISKIIFALVYYSYYKIDSL